MASNHHDTFAGLDGLLPAGALHSISYHVNLDCFHFLGDRGRELFINAMLKEWGDDLRKKAAEHVARGLPS